MVTTNTSGVKLYLSQRDLSLSEWYHKCRRSLGATHEQAYFCQCYAWGRPDTNGMWQGNYSDVEPEWNRRDWVGL